MNNKLDVKFDMDGILVNLIGTWLQDLTQAHGVRVTVDDLREFRLERAAPLAHLTKEAILAPLIQPNYFTTLPAVPGALEAVEAIHRAGHKVSVVTALPGTGSHARHVRDCKLAWLRKNMPWLPADRVHFAEAEEKHNHPADVFVDDRADTLETYKQKNPDALVAGILYPYNRHLLPRLYEREMRNVIALANDHRRTVSAWGRIRGWIDNLAAYGHPFDHRSPDA